MNITVQKKSNSSCAHGQNRQWQVTTKDNQRALVTRTDIEIETGRELNAALHETPRSPKNDADVSWNRQRPELPLRTLQTLPLPVHHPKCNSSWTDSDDFSCKEN